MINAGLVEAAELRPGHGDLRLGLGYDTGIGLFGELGVRHRFNEYLYGFAKGSIGSGPRINRLDGRVYAGLGGEW